MNLPPPKPWRCRFLRALFNDSSARVVIHVCDDLACLVRGAPAICEQLGRRLGPAGAAKPSEKLTWLRSPCLGLCERAPAALVSAAGRKPWECSLAPTTADALLAAVERPDRKTGAPARPRIPQRPATGPTRIAPVAPRRPPPAREPAGSSGPRGIRGLAAGRRTGSRAGHSRGYRFQAGGKGWGRLSRGAEMGGGLPRRSSQPVRYLVCNADESEPGNLQGPGVMEEDPFLLIESMTIAGLATGCQQGLPLHPGRIPPGLRAPEPRHPPGQSPRFPGQKDLESGPVLRHRDPPGSRRLHLRRGDGPVQLDRRIPGRATEQAALPDRGGAVRSPHPGHNVETLVNVSGNRAVGRPVLAASGTPRSTGTKLFCLLGPRGPAGSL